MSVPDTRVASAIRAGKALATDHAEPFQRSTRDPPVLRFTVNAQTSFGESAPAAMTSSPDTLGNAALAHVLPFSRQAVAFDVSPRPSNAQAVVLPVTARAGNWPEASVFTVLTTRQRGPVAVAAPLAAAAGTDSASRPAAVAAAVSHTRRGRGPIMGGLRRL